MTLKSDINTSVLILGAGTFGLSTAYHLSKSGYKNITVLEKGSSVPSEFSAGNDLNKIIRAEYEDPFYAELALDAIKEWQSPLFAPYYHQNGYLLATSATAPAKSKATLQRSLSSISSHPAFADQIIPINKRDTISSLVPVFDGPMAWTGYFNKRAGYAHAADAMRAVYSACIALGVTFHLDDGVTEILYSGNKCIGASTASGKQYKSPLTIICLGASAASLIPSIHVQVTGKAWPVAHVALTPEEAAPLMGIPVTYARDIGFFFEPDPKTHLLKLCSANAGITNYQSGSRLSVPPTTTQQYAFIPTEDEQLIRRLLRETLPKLADRPLINKTLCWCADTRDSEYIIDFVPGKEGLAVISGDSGHGYKMLPVLGKWVKELIEGGEQSKKRWKWKDVKDDGDVDISWRVGMPQDMKDIKSKI
ncbi:MAG: hypothetical protein M1834_007835 [Cirrosporium novae-zelandiae]|nr:MAG: hypothetical protein M1834_007835 [Cirrosporium novae-zelandiae]